jgi:hypothetical protein
VGESQRLGKNSLHTRFISICRRKTKIKKDIYPQMSQMNTVEQEESIIFLFLSHLRSSATSADTLSFSLLCLAQPRSVTHAFTASDDVGYPALHQRDAGGKVRGQAFPALLFLCPWAHCSKSGKTHGLRGRATSR